MLIRNIKKIYGKGIVSIRDYELAQAVKEGGMILKYKGQTKTMSSYDLARIFQCHKKFVTSKIPGWKNPETGKNGYELVDIT